jgi:quercetin dioxygenase-like cupin family protein
MEFDRFVSKGWGFERWVVNGPLYCGKLLFVAKGKKCSWHYHKLKDETFHLLSGKVRLWFLSESAYQRLRERYTPLDIDEVKPNLERNVRTHADHKVLKAGDTFHVPPGMPHQFEGVFDSTILEVSTEHKDEDSYRIIKGD